LFYTYLKVKHPQRTNTGAWYMSEPFLAEIKMVGFNFAPRGWGFCDGQLLPINQNQSLFALLGASYGGDGRTNFALPDLRGRVPIHDGRTREKGGQETHALTVQEMPSHTHQAQASPDGTGTATAAGNVLAATGAGRRAITPYANLSPPVALTADTVGNTGNGVGHDNMQPYLTLNFCIALQGLFPSRN
jgi:microcystin-dependent protein